MRRKQVELQERVIRAVRAVTLHIPRGTLATAWPDEWDELFDSLDELDAYLNEGALTAPGQWVEGSPETSENAALMATPSLASWRRRILDEVRGLDRIHAANADWMHGLTIDELETRLHGPHTSISSATNSLVNGGFLRDSGYRRLTRRGRDAVVWELTPAARELMSSPQWMTGQEVNR